MPDFICKDCGYVARDNWVMEKHLKRKNPCKVVVVVEKQNLIIKKKDHNGEANVIPTNKIKEKEMTFDIINKSIKEK